MAALMRVWVLKDGEHLPVQAGLPAMRTGSLARELHRRGHQVTWWASTFSHQHKTLLYEEDALVSLEPGYDLRLLHAGSYSRNISPARYRHHWRTGDAFRRASERLPRPDVIVTAFPTIDLAYEAVSYGERHGVPVIVDVRDLWPDFMVEKVPAALRPVARILLRRDFARTGRALSGATSIVATSHGYLQWGLDHAGRSAGHGDRVFYIGAPDVQRQADPPSGVIQDLAVRLTGKVVCVFVGSFGRSYQLDLIAEVARRVQAQGDIHFVLAGDGQQAGMLRRAAAELPNLTLTGWVGEADMAAVLRLGSIGLTPCHSARDCMPNKVFAYFGAGLPVVSSLEGEMETLLAETGSGVSYRPGDVEALTQHILHLAATPGTRGQMAAASRRTFEQAFESARIYSEYAAHVEHVATSQVSTRDARAAHKPSYV